MDFICSYFSTLWLMTIPQKSFKKNILSTKYFQVIPELKKKSNPDFTLTKVVQFLESHK